MGPLVRNKTIFTIATLLVVGIAIGVAHSRSLDSARPLLVQQAVRGVIHLPAASLNRLLLFGADSARALRPRSMIQRENNNLRKRVRDLTAENASLREAASENALLRKQLALKRSLPYNTIAASVILRRESNWFHTATIDRGSRAGVERSAAVVNHLGLIGQVLESTAFNAQIVSITDPSSAIGAAVQRSRSSGILHGQGADYLVLTYLPKDADVRKSDLVVTSGVGRVIPKGLVIGRVVKVVRNTVAGTTSALVRPSVRFDQAEQVLVIKPAQGYTQ